MNGFLISSAYADAPGGGLLSNSSFLSFAPMVLVFGVFYFLLIRPQQAKQKQLKADLNNLRRGDRVVTAGGIVGVVQKTREGTSEIEVEIAPNVRVAVMRDTITTILSSASKPANDSKA